MNRKTFLKNSAIVATGLGCLGTWNACNTSKKQAPESELQKLDALGLAFELEAAQPWKDRRPVI